MSTVQLANVTKTHPDGTTAVRDLDLTIEDGELVVLVGPPGCGKSTVLRMIAGLEAPTGGDVLVDGVRVDELMPGRDVAMAVPDALYPHMTAAENLDFPLRVARMRRRRRAVRVEEIARRLGLADVLDHLPHNLTRSQQQRVALGRSIIRNPSVLLVDDLLSCVETKPRTELRYEIVRIQQSGPTTMVFATRDEVEAMAIAGRVVVMREGRVVQCGPPDDIYDRPIDVFVGRLMGAPPMNLFQATVIASPGGLDLQIGHQTISIDDVTATVRPEWIELAGRNVACGIRPEALHHDEHGSLVTGLVSTELLGSDRQLVHAWIDAPSVSAADGGLTVGPERHTIITTYLPADQNVSPWEPLTLRIDTRELHLFDVVTGVPI